MAESPYPDWMSTVLDQVEPDGLRWRVLAGWTQDRHLMTSVYLDSPDAGAQPVGGFGGPPVWDGELINTWHGQGPGSPGFVVIRGRESVTTVEVDLGTGPAIDITLSPVIEDFGVRFGACVLPRHLDARDVRPQFRIPSQTAAR